MDRETPYVVDIMSQDPVVVGPETPAWSAECVRKKRGVHYLLVIDGYRLVGVVCGCDLHRAEADAPVADCMQVLPTTIDDQERGDLAVQRMQRCGVGCLPVVDWAGMLKGVLTRHDLRRAGLLEESATRHCAACGTTHGLEPMRLDDEDAPAFCLRCREQSEAPKSAIDREYFTLGGGD